MNDKRNKKRYLVFALLFLLGMVFSIYDFAVNKSGEHSFKAFLRFLGIFLHLYWSVYFYGQYRKLTKRVDGSVLTGES